MRLALALWRSSHPGPTVVVTALAVALGVSIGLQPWRIAVLAVAVLVGQLSIGLSNDAIDAPRDRIAGRTDKPIARSDVSLRAAWTAAVTAAMLSLGLSVTLSWQMALAHTVFIASGWAYNAWLKSTVWSAACFVVGFGVFPSLAPLSGGTPVAAAGWAWMAGAALGVAVHFSNVLPDLDDDARTGVRGLPHRLGRKASATVAAAALAVGAGCVLVGPAIARHEPPGLIGWLLSTVVVIIALWALIAALVGPPQRLVFQLVMSAALVLAIELVLVGGLAG